MEIPDPRAQMLSQGPGRSEKPVPWAAVSMIEAV